MDALRRAARRTPDAPAVGASEHGRPLVSFAELNRDADAVGRWLESRTEPGDVVAMRLPFDSLALALIHGAWRVGRVLAPLALGWTDREVDDALVAVGAPSVIVDDSGALREAVEEGVTTLAGGAAADPDPSRVRVLLCTSGTSGRPRAVPITEANLAASAAAAASRLRLTPDDRWLGSLSPSHVGGFALAHRAAAFGSSVVPLPRFDAGRVAALVDAGAVSHMSLVPTMLLRLIDIREERLAPESLRCVLVGGAPCPPSLLRRAIGCGYPVALTYGLTEATSQVATASPMRVRRKPGVVGPPLPGVALRIEGPGDDQPGLADGVGEILVRGPTVSREALSDDGWLHTGDLGRIDEDGDLRVVGRLSDAIVTGGVTVHPSEIEAVLASHPAVEDVAVTGIPDEEWGQLVAVAVEPRSADRPPGLADLLSFSRPSLSAAKRPRSIRIVEALPRNPNGKIDRKRLPELWTDV